MGSTIAYQLAHGDLFGEIMLLDVKHDAAVGQALDIQQSLINSKTNITAVSDYEDVDGSDVVIITAGKPRSPNMSRLDLMNSNKDIVANIAKKIAVHSASSSIITMTNPADVMNYVVWKVTGFEKNRVVANGSNLDTQRLKSVLSKRYKAEFSDIDCITIGEHGARQIPIFSQAKVAGKPLNLSDLEMSKLREDVLTSPDKIIETKGSTQYAPASSVAELTLMMIKGTKKPFPCSAILNGEYGYSDISIGVPVTFKKRRVNRIVEIEMGTYEKKLFAEGAEKLKKICEELKI